MNKLWKDVQKDDGCVAALLDDWREKLAAYPNIQQKRTLPTSRKQRVNNNNKDGGCGGCTKLPKCGNAIINLY